MNTSATIQNNNRTDLKIALITQGLSRVVEPICHNFKPHLIIESAPRGALPLRNRNPVIHWLKTNFSESGRLYRYCKKRKIDYVYLEKDNIKDIKVQLEELRPDVLIVYSMSQLLPADIICIPRYGCINLHPSALPEYRGPNPWFWMYHDKIATAGITLHYLDAKEDTGDVIFTGSYQVKAGMRSPEMQQIAISEIGVSFILKALTMLQQGEPLPRTPQPAVSTTARARAIKPSEHKTLIDWANWPADRIWHLMRGTELWLDCIDQPGGLYQGTRWIIEGLEASSAPANATQYGTIARDSVGHYVIAKDGIIRIRRKFNFKSFIKRTAEKLLT